MISHMYLLQNMKVLFNYLIWSYVSALLPFLGPKASHLCQQSASLTNDSVIIMERIPSDLPSNYTSKYVAVTHSYQNLMFVKDRCSDKRLIFISPRFPHVWMTVHGSQRSWFTLFLSKTDDWVTEYMVTSFVLTNTHLVVAVNNGIQLVDLHTLISIESQGITADQPVTAVRNHQCCYSELQWCKDWANLLIAYNSIDATAGFYFSIDGGVHFELFTLGSSYEKYWIVDVTTLATDLTVLLLVKSSVTDLMKLIAVPLNTHRHVHLFDDALDTFNITDFNDMTSLSFYQLYSNFGSLLFWDNEKLTYRARFSSKASTVEIYASTQASSKFLTKNEKVRHIDSNEFGEFLIITTNNRLLYGREGVVTQAIYLDTLHNYIDQYAVVMFGGADTLLIVQEDVANRTELPLMIREMSITQLIKAASSTVGLESCPHHDFVLEEFQGYYEMDTRDVLEIWSHIHIHPWYSVSMLTEMSTKKSLKLSTELDHKPISEAGAIRLTMRTVARVVLETFERHNVSQKDQIPLLGSDVTNLRILTIPTSLMCAAPSQRVTHISFGCTQGKSIRPRRVQRECDPLRHQFRYTLELDEYDPDMGKFGQKHANHSKIVDYYFGLYGCPNRTYYNDPFTFDIHLYNGNRYVGPIDGDYVVYEVNGVNQYHYNLKVKDSGCLYPPQSWREMRLLARKDQAVGDAWTRENYKSCMLEADLQSDERKYKSGPESQYEVMNKYNGNYITFDRNGIFLFEIIVVDRDYSFCDLRTHFAVEVYGVQPKVMIPFFIVMSVSLTLMVLILVAIFCLLDYRRKSKISQEQEMEEIEAFEEAVEKYTEDQMKKAELSEALLAHAQLYTRIDATSSLQSPEITVLEPTASATIVTADHKAYTNR